MRQDGPEVLGVGRAAIAVAFCFSLVRRRFFRVSKPPTVIRWWMPTVECAETTNVTSYSEPAPLEFCTSVHFFRVWFGFVGMCGDARVCVYGSSFGPVAMNRKKFVNGERTHR